MPKKNPIELLAVEVAKLIREPAPAAPAMAVAIRLPGKAKRRAPRKPSPEWEGVKKKCPHCGKTKLVVPDFGVVIKRGVEQSHSWCKQCRSSTHYYNQPRKYRTANSTRARP